jgi:heme A synthase
MQGVAAISPRSDEERQERKSTMRITLAILCLLATVGMLAITLTSPAIAATAPAVLTLGLAAATYLVWPKRRRRKEAS